MAGTIDGDIVQSIRAFDAYGASTIEHDEQGIKYLVNEYWTAGQRRAHSIHEVSYRACIKPQLSEFFISRLTAPGDTVHDPFAGRGTTAVQAALMRRGPSANDINPLSALLTRPRLAPPPLASVATMLARIPWERPCDLPEELLAFFHTAMLTSLVNLRDHLLSHAPLNEAAPDPALDWVRMVALGRLTGHSPGFFSVYTLPPNQAVT